jgi:hypothetical protein
MLLLHGTKSRNRPTRAIAFSGGALVAVMMCAGMVGRAEGKAATTSQPVSLKIQAGADSTTNQMLVLRGADCRRQILVTADLGKGAAADYTHRVSYEANPTGIVNVTSNGVLLPLADGTATITAKCENGLAESLQVRVEQFKSVRPINFPNQIVPIFTKAGCNAGGCHGKSSGQNGFKLSLLGFEPSEDYEHLVKEARGRRIFPAAPANSLLLLKATAALPHGGGKRIEPDSDDYRLLSRWIAQGMPYGKPDDPVVERIEVFPRQRTVQKSGSQQLTVLAQYTDGSIEDVTRSALYEANDKDIAVPDANGEVKFFEQPGDVAVMVRYQAKVAVFNATIPLGAPIEHFPPAKNFIDELVFKKLAGIGMPPSTICDDATFLRRAAIDIAGRLPNAEETQRFLSETNAMKREQWIDTLLDSSEYADYFANKWTALLRNKRTDAKQMRSTYAFHDWIRDSLIENKPYDQFVREILTATGDIDDNPAVAWYRQVKDPTSELEDTAQLFLGQRLQCAQCHHHPFEKWSQQDYYSFAAFFSQVSRKAGPRPGEEMVFHRRGVASATNKKTKQPAKPAGLGAGALAISADDDPRGVLADWMTSKTNRFFARSLANRYWKHFFNRGLVEPEDDMRETNPPTNPELLDALARNFSEHGYDLKNLVRTICRSQAYQLSALPNKFNAVDKQNFSRFYPKRLTAEVLFDAVNAVTKSESAFDGLPRGTHAVALPDNSFNASSYFLTVFGRPDASSASECERSQDASLAQSLHLLNAKEIQDKIAADTGRAALLAADKRSDEEKIRELYYLAYAREPESKEMEIATHYLKKTKPDKGGKEVPINRRQAYEDILWALINTKEFLFNH